MGKVVVVTSGKGGVGKTTSTAALGAAIARGGSMVAVVDFDVGLRNLDLMMGAERRVIHDLTSVVQGTAELSQALLPDTRLDTLWLLPASQTRGKEVLTEDGVARVVDELRDRFDWVICDSPAGNERGALLAMRFADEAILVVNPEISSVRDAGRIIAHMDTWPAKAASGERLDRHLLITRFDPQRVASGEMLSLEDVCAILPAPLLGIIPESDEVLRASNLGAPITVCARDSDVSRAYLDAARRLCGDPVTMMIPAATKGIFTRILGGRAA